jgi:hypothetical protein
LDIFIYGRLVFRPAGALLFLILSIPCSTTTAAHGTIALLGIIGRGIVALLGIALLGITLLAIALLAITLLAIALLAIALLAITLLAIALLAITLLAITLLAITLLGTVARVTSVIHPRPGVSIRGV